MSLEELGSVPVSSIGTKAYFVQTLKKGFIKPGLSYADFRKWLVGDYNAAQLSETKINTEYAYYLEALATGAVAAKSCGALGMTLGHFLVILAVLLSVFLIGMLKTRKESVKT